MVLFVPPNAGAGLLAPKAGVAPDPNAGAVVPPNGVPELAAPNAGATAPCCCWFCVPNGVAAVVPKFGTDVAVVAGAELPNTGDGLAEDELEPKPPNTELEAAFEAVGMNK